MARPKRSKWPDDVVQPTLSLAPGDECNPGLALSQSLVEPHAEAVANELPT
jgi:hypothetical protein